MRHREKDHEVVGRLTRRQFAQAAAFGIYGSAIANCPASQAAETCLQSVPGTDLTYYLIVFDKDGRERAWGDGTLCSEKCIARLKEGTITDVFIFSHGWMGDVPQAKLQYENWIGAMARCGTDIEAMKRVRPGFSPLLIGIHWPSLPLGDERLLSSEGFGAGVTNEQFERIVHSTADTPRARHALHTIVTAAQQPPTDRLPPGVLDAFRDLPREAGLSARGVAAPPGRDAAEFNPETLYDELRSSRTFGATEQASGPVWNSNLVFLLALFSFWKMKDRARMIGETGGHKLLHALQAAVPSNRPVGFHFMGHSFGCIFVSAMIQGGPGLQRIARPASSLSLIQGALSHWAYCTNVTGTGKPGYFRPLIDRRIVAGPIITTQSVHDTAVGTWYPMAAEWRRQKFMAGPGAPEFPEYGAIGCFGIQGENCAPQNRSVLAVTQSYGFKPGRIFNVECSQVIAKKSPFSGAHSDIAHAEVAHAVWEAAAVGASLDASKPTPAPNPAPPLPPRWFLRRRRQKRGA